MSTLEAILNAAKKSSELKMLVDWWGQSTDLEREYLIEYLTNSGLSSNASDEEEEMALASVVNLLEEMGGLSEEALEQLEKIQLAAGRAAYSFDTLMRLNRNMREKGNDFFTARKEEFGVEDNWTPSANPLGTPTGNPAVDRTIKAVSRWLRACEKAWGRPETVNIEHVREGFISPKHANEIKKEANARYKANLEIKKEIIESLSDDGDYSSAGIDALRHADVRKWQAIQRQNSQCIYCGTKIDFMTAQMDHIVPRKGAGSSNELSNLVAACEGCNASKGKTLFSAWADSERQAEVLNRVDTWIQDSYFSSAKQFNGPCPHNGVKDGNEPEARLPSKLVIAKPQ